MAHGGVGSLLRGFLGSILGRAALLRRTLLRSALGLGPPRFAAFDLGLGLAFRLPALLLALLGVLVLGLFLDLLDDDLLGAAGALELLGEVLGREIVGGAVDAADLVAPRACFLDR